MDLVKVAPYIAVTAVAALGICAIKLYARGGVCRSKARLDGKVIIVTGANAGIGKETVKDLARRGAKVYLGCRSLARAKEAVDEIQKETGVSADKLPVIRLDLASLKSVREFVKEFKAKETKLDILINNAGIFWPAGRKTEDGFELAFGVNHLGHFLLTLLLMDCLAASSKSRIVNVSAKLHEVAKLDFDDLMFEKRSMGFGPYNQSKLANILFTRELANRLKGTGITAYSLHPGVIATEISRDLPLMGYIRPLTLLLFWPFNKSLWAGAQTTIYCAVDEKLANESGKYYSDCREKEPSRIAQDDAVARKLWDISVELVKLEPLEIHPKLKSQ